MVRVYWRLMCKIIINAVGCLALNPGVSYIATPPHHESEQRANTFLFCSRLNANSLPWVLLRLKLFCCPASCIRVGVNAFHPPSNRLAVARSSRRISNQLFRLSCVAFPASARNTTPGPYTEWFRRLAIWSISVGSSREPNFRDHTGKTKTRYPWLGKLYCPCVWWCFACSSNGLCVNNPQRMDWEYCK